MVYFVGLLFVFVMACLPAKAGLFKPIFRFKDPVKGSVKEIIITKINSLSSLLNKKGFILIFSFSPAQ